MFIGHFGVGFAAKKAAPGLSLGLLFIAVQFLDLLWPTLLLLNIEHVEITPGITKLTPLNFTDYPYSHSLMMALVWAALFSGVYLLLRKNIRYALILALCVLSHWVLDLLVHRPDLPLFPGQSPKAGFGLWNYPVLEVIIEMLIFITGIILYIVQTKPKNAAGRYVLLILILMFLLSHIANLAGSAPPSVTAIAWAGQLQWLFVLLAFWADRNREIRKPLTVKQ